MIYGYTRVSTIEQAASDRSSLSDQQRTIMGRAMIIGQAVHEIFEDAGISGAIPVDQRPAGSRLMAVLKRGDTIIAAKMDRIFRSSLDALQTAEKLREMGVSLILEDMGGNVMENGTARLFFTMAAAFAEFERERIKERVMTGKASKKARGGHIGGSRPFGYRIEGTGRDAMLVEDPAEQAAIRDMKIMRVTGMAYHKIAEALGKRGISVSREVVRQLTQA